MYRKDANLSSLPDRHPAGSRAFTNACRTLSVLLLLGILAALYFFGIRPAQLRWGATPGECARAMPDDALVADPTFNATRAITIQATPSQIWPWLIQMGFGRAGFYGYDLIENLGSGRGIRSAQTIIPALQSPKPGDELPLSIAATLVYGPIQPNQFMIWRSADVPCDGTFVWELVPIDATHTRLISRIRWNYVKSPPGFLLGVFTEFTDHVAVRKILEGVRDRAEGRPPQPLISQAIDIAGYVVAGFNLLLALYAVGFWRKWIRGWLLALAAGLLLEIVLYGALPAVLRDALPWALLVLILLIASKSGRSRFDSRPAFE